MVVVETILHLYLENLIKLITATASSSSQVVVLIALITATGRRLLAVIKS